MSKLLFIYSTENNLSCLNYMYYLTIQLLCLKKQASLFHHTYE